MSEHIYNTLAITRAWYDSMCEILLNEQAKCMKGNQGVSLDCLMFVKQSVQSDQEGWDVIRTLINNFMRTITNLCVLNCK